MIQRKKKICKLCKDPHYLFSKGLCKSCWQKEYGKPIKRESKPIVRQSTQGKDRERKYQDCRRKYMLLHSACERCGSKNDLDLHHKAGRDGENRYQHFMTVCRNCHQWIHEHVAESYVLGYLLSRLKNE